jgi:negative regulator of flagellin synthesis FlgM
MSYASGIGSQHGAIDSISPSGAKPAIQANGSDGIANEGAGPIPQVEHADQTSLSSAGGLVAQALESSDIRSAKVASLQQAIAAGSYSVSSSDVADKIIQSLLGKA